MTKDAQAEAERIVGEIVANETAVLPWVKDIDAWHEHQERVEAALAAAIEWREATHRAMERDEDYGYSMTGTEVELLQALSALRARAGEETG